MQPVTQQLNEVGAHIIPSEQKRKLRPEVKRFAPVTQQGQDLNPLLPCQVSVTQLCVWEAMRNREGGLRPREGGWSPASPRPARNLRPPTKQHGTAEPRERSPTGYPENGGSSLLSTHLVMDEGDEERALPAHPAHSSGCRSPGRWVGHAAEAWGPSWPSPLPGLAETTCSQGFWAHHIRTGTRSFPTPSCSSFCEFCGF